MELIYADHNLVEQGMLQDYSFDVAYGKDENDFEIITPATLDFGMYWHIKGSEYGGIVDEIENQTNTDNNTYRGRTLHGVLNSYNGYQISDVDTEELAIVTSPLSMNVRGKPSELLRTFLTQIGLDFFDVVSAIEDEDEIITTVERKQGLYDLMSSICQGQEVKLIFTFETRDYKLVPTVTLIPTSDYASEMYFDISQHTATYTDNDVIPNHLIGIYQKNDWKTIVKHIYIKEDGTIAPYYVLDGDHAEPVDNREYERADDIKYFTGIEENVLLVEGGSTRENYDVVRPLTANSGNTEFQGNRPKDWLINVYDNYYYIDEEGNFKNEQQVFEHPELVVNQSNWDWWGRNWVNYYKRTGTAPNYSYSPLTDDDIPKHTEKKELIYDYDSKGKYYIKPKDWNWNFSKYFTRVYISGEWRYTSVPAKSYEDYVKQTSKPRPFKPKELYVSYRRQVWEVYVRVLVSGKWYTQEAEVVKGTLKNSGIIKKYKKTGDIQIGADSGKGASFKYKKIEVDNPLTKKDKKYNLVKKSGKVLAQLVINYVKSEKERKITGAEYLNETGQSSSVLTWKSRTYYEKQIKQTYPAFNKRQQNGYWKDYEEWETDRPPMSDANHYYCTEEDVDKPAYEQGKYYIKVEDDYSDLCAKMLEEWEKVKEQKSKLNATLSTDVTTFDVGDIISGVHPTTKQNMFSRITKKIAKGTPDGIEVSYEIG